MKRLTLLFFSCLFILSSSSEGQEISYAEKLMIDLHGKMPVALEGDHMVNWYNLGQTYGTFGNYGFDGPLDQYPQFEETDSINAITFDGDDWMSMNLPAPASITDQNFSVEVWAYNPTIEENETLLSWASPTASTEGLSLNYGSSTNSGAVAHGNGKNLGYGNQLPEAGQWHHIVLTFQGGQSGNSNIALSAGNVSTDYCSSWETLGAINDGHEPTASTDRSKDIYGNWDSHGEWRYIQYEWSKPYSIAQSDVYWYEEGPDAGLQRPDSSYLEYWDLEEETWKEVPNPSTAKDEGHLLDQYNTTTFDTVSTTKLRLNMYREDASTGVIEWKVTGEGDFQTGESLYVDGRQIFTEQVDLDLSDGGKVYLGCDATQNNHFSGSIAAVRIHRGQMDPQQVLANYEGGINLGTTFQPNIQDEPRGSTFADPEKEEGLICRESEHFRVCWFDYNDTDNVMDQRVPDQLDKAEKLYKLYNRKMAMMPPIVSSKAENRGDGKRYKIEIATNWDGGFFGGNIPAGFGYPIQSPGILSAHELTHAYQMHFLGSNPGPWWEVHANWVPSRNNDPHVNPAGVSMSTAPLYPGHGRNYYHSYLIYNHLANQEEYGERFIARLWEDNPDSDTFHWNTAREIDPDPSTPILDEWAKMAQKNITWDYQRQSDYKAEGNQKKRLGWVTLKPIPYEEGWYRVSKDMAPMQFGWNICPLKATGDQVSVELSGYINPERGSDWRAGFVAVDDQGNPRYGEIFGQEKATFTMESDEQELYLVVAGTPEKLMNLETIHDNRAPAAERFIYKVKLEGAEPLDFAKPGESVLSGSEHPNGGGFVARSATVDESVWVGPNAQVLNAAKVRGHARIEGHAVVKSDAVVQDRAVVSGHAIVQGRVEGDAMVGDYATIPRGTTVKDHAKVFEHAQPSEGITLSGHAVAKGYAAVLNNISGTAICDASYAKTNELDKGVWLTWSWGSGNNAGDLDEQLDGLYAQHRFDEQHPFYAWDTYGVTHGFKVGNPSIISTSEGSALQLNGTDQFVELQDDIGRMADVSIEMNLKWQGSTNQQKILEFTDNQNKRAYLTPSDEEGKLAFVIQTGEQQNTLQYDQPLSQDTWVHLQLIVHGNTAALYLDGEQVAQNQYFTLDLRDVSATVGYLGRGKDGNYFQGLVESISFYSTPLIEQEQTEQITTSEDSEATDLVDEKSLSISTFPASNRIDISCSASNPIDNVQIIDSMGRIILNKTQIGTNKAQIQLNSSGRGIFIVVVTCEKGTYKRKVLM